MKQPRLTPGLLLPDLRSLALCLLARLLATALLLAGLVAVLTALTGPRLILLAGLPATALLLVGLVSIAALLARILILVRIIH